MKRNLLALFYAGLSALSNIILSVIRTKLVAVTLGPAGVGIISQIYIFTTNVTNLATLGITNGVIKYVSEYNETDQTRLEALRKTVFRTIFLLSLVLTLGSIIIAEWLGLQLLNTTEYTLYLIIALALLPISQLSMLMTLYLNGLNRIKELTKIGIRNAIVSTLITIISVNLFGLTGFFFGTILSNLIAVALTYAEYKKHEKANLIQDLFHLTAIDWKIVKKLFAFGLASLVVGLSFNYSQLFIRAQIIENIGLEGNGIFQAAWAISNQYLGLVLGAMGTFTLPEMSRLNDNVALVKQINITLRLSLLIIVPVIALILILREPLITFLYSDKFSDTGKILHYQLVADLFKVMSWSIGMSLVARAKAFTFAALDIGFNFCFAIFSFIFLRTLGLEGISLAYLIDYVIFFTISYFILKQYFDLKLEKKNLILVLSSLVLVGFVSFVSSQPDYLISITSSFGLLVLWGVVSVEKSEIHQVKALIKQKLQKFSLLKGTR